MPAFHQVRTFFSRHPERLLSSERIHYSGPGDAEPSLTSSYDTIAAEALRQQETAIDAGLDHVRPLVLSSAQGTHSTGIDEHGLPYAHGCGINGALTVQNTETGLPSVHHGHFEYKWHGAEPGWGLDVPMVSAQQVCRVLFGPQGPPEPVGEDCIAATFPVAAPVAVEQPPICRPTLIPAAQVALTQIPDSQSPKHGDPRKQATRSVSSMHPSHPEVLCPAKSTLDLQISELAKTDLMVLAEESRSQHPYKEESAAEWINRAVRDLYDESVPASAAKTRFQDAFLKEQSGMWSKPPPDSAWAPLNHLQADCDRCNLQQAHLASFCPSQLADSSRIHPLVSTCNAFMPRNLPPHLPQLQEDSKSLPPRPSTPYPLISKLDKSVLTSLSERPVPPIPQYTTCIVQEPESYADESTVRCSQRRIHAALPLPSFSSVLTGQSGPDSPRQSSDFMVYLDDHVLDRLCSARHNIGELGPEAYVIETNPMGEQVLRLPGIDSIVDQMIDEWGYVPFSSTNSMDLPECTKFFQDLYQAWNYLPQRIDRAAVVAQLRIAIDFPGAAPHIQIPAPSNPEDQEWERLGVPQTLIHSMFTATRKPFETPKAVQQYPTRRNGAPATTDDGNEIPIRRRSPLPWDFDRNSPSMVAFAGYLDEEVFDHIWTIRRAIGNGGCQYPDISDTSNQAHHLEDLGNDHYELRVPGFDNLCEALRDHWNYRVLSPFFR